MKNLFERLTARFKEFWHKSKKNTVNNLSVNSSNCPKFFDVIPINHIFCSLPDCTYQKLLGESNSVKTKIQKCYLCLQNELDPADVEVFKKMSSFEEIAEKLKTDLCVDSEKVYVDCLLSNADEKIKMKKRIFVVGKSYFKDKLN